MRDPRCLSSYLIKTSLLLVGLMVGVFALPFTVAAQGGTSGTESIPAGSLIIAMDNERQGNAGDCNGPAFNIRAYGLAVRLLHQNVQLKWVINTSKTGNATNDINDVNVSQLNTATYGGQTCQHTGGATTDFRGGPLVVPPAFAATAKTVLASFNGSTTPENDVRVFEVLTGFTGSVRYTLTHKPFIAVGPDCTPGGDCFSQNVYQRLYAAAGMIQGTHYANVADNTFNNFCVTLAAQAHAQATATNFINDYIGHVQDGGNLLLQCASVELFEDIAQSGTGVDGAGNGFFTTAGITDAAGDTGHASPVIQNAYMPYNQYVGSLGTANGWTNFTLPSGSYLTGSGLLHAARQEAASGDPYMAFTRDLTAGVGGNVFGLGGHEYGGYEGDGVAASGGPDVSGGELERVNGSRMALNTILIPANPACSFAPPSIQGYKTVRIGTGAEDVNGNGQVNFGDIVEWTVRYINTGVTPIANFQITDELEARLQLVIGSLNATATAGSTVAINSGYRGNTNNGDVAPVDINLLNPNSSSLAAGGMITVRFKTKAIGFGDIPNQAAALGNGIGTPVLSDSADNTTPGNTGGYPIAGDCTNSPICVDQSAWVLGDPDNWTGNIEPTYIDLGTIPTAAGADVAGIVADSKGRGLAREQVVLQDASSGEVRFAATNSFGRFAFRDVPVGSFYILTVVSKRYTFETASYSFDLVDNLTDIEFIAQIPGRVVPQPPVSKAAVSNSVREPVTSKEPAKAEPAVRRSVIVTKPVKKKSKDDEEPAETGN